MMLRQIGKKAEVDKLENAVAAVIVEGKSVTYDMKPRHDNSTFVGASVIADAIFEKISA